ncbi:hypothetical protein B5E53_00810 [Eubacterium sp. An11]|uniref:DUF975 family protein n=1 Tax=Eubacterium sp. An11 TaxID=1965542 RepID=UPI000B39CCC8|nr:DUF975 family protein [Eubacterium sp. An11]OUQ70192.1 hypothetical protein B5E53_00810 [Eubacterium sp. An11]
MKLTSAEYKEIARDALKGNWGRAIGAMLIAACLSAFFTSLYFISHFMFIMSVAIRIFENLPHYFLMLVGIGIVLAVFFFFAGGPARFGYIDFNLALLDRREAVPSMVLGRFSLIWKGMYMKIALFFYELFFTILLIIPGIVTMYAYAMVPYILEEKKDYTVGKAMKMSRKIMRGHKWELFCLRFSFLGWYILSLLTFGLALFYVLPYMNTAEAVFYNEISGRADAFYGRESLKEAEPEV